MTDSELQAEAASDKAKGGSLGKFVRWTFGGLAFCFLVIQLVPYGRDHTNPPVLVDISWDSPKTEALVRGACFDCHSNETRWPWYSHIAPVSWLVQRDVDKGRKEMNFSTGHLEEIEEAPEEIQEGEMPPWFYKPTHLDAWLSREEERALISGIRATFRSAMNKSDHDHEPRHKGAHDDDSDEG